MADTKNPFVPGFDEVRYEASMTERTKMTTEQRRKMVNAVCDDHNRRFENGELVDRRPPHTPWSEEGYTPEGKHDGKSNNSTRSTV